MARYCGVVVTQRTYGDYKFYRKRQSGPSRNQTIMLIPNPYLRSYSFSSTFQLSKIMYSFINISLPDPLITIFIVNRYIHSHETRSLHQPHIQYRKTSFLSKTFIYLAPEIWYKLPETIIQLRS